MDNNDISSVINLFINFMCNDNDIRLTAENEIQELIKNDPINFAQILFLIMQNYQNFSLDTVLLCFIFLRKIFSRATNALKTGDHRLSYLIIPQDVADSSIPLISSFLSNQNIQIADNASYLLGKVAIYLLNFNQEHPIFFSLIQQIDSGLLILPSLKTIYILLSDDFQLFSFNESFQQEFMKKIQFWLVNPNFPFDSKPFLIKIITLLIPVLSHILLKPEDNESFVQMMLLLTQVPEFKFDSYKFWSNLSNEIPQLVIWPKLPLSEISIKDLDERLNKYPNLEYDDEPVILQILEFWLNMCLAEINDTESTLYLIKSMLPSFLPFILLNAEKVVDTSILPQDEGYSIFYLICECITSFTSLYPELSIPILLNYGFQAIESTEIKKKEIGLFAINSAIFQFPNDNDQYLQYCKQCIAFSLDLIGREINFNSTEELRIISQAVTNIYYIAYLFPDLIDYSTILPRLVEFMNSPISGNSTVLIMEIVKNDKFKPSLLLPLMTSLLNAQTYESINCVWDILAVKHDIEINQQIYPQIISIIESILANESNNDYITVLLTPLLRIIGFEIDTNEEILIQNYQRLIQIFFKCYENNDNSEAIRILAISARITNDPELLTYVLQQIIYQLDSQASEVMISSCLDSIIFDLNSIDISIFFNELMRSLFTIQDISTIVYIKIKILSAINSLHQSFPNLMQPYLTRLIPLFGSAVVSFEKIDDEDKKKLLIELLKASFMFIQFAYQKSDSESFNNEMKQFLQISYRSVQCFLNYGDYDPDIIIPLFDLLNALIQKDPVTAKKIIMEGELFQFIRTLIDSTSDDPFPSLTPIIQLLTKT